MPSHDNGPTHEHGRNSIELSSVSRSRSNAGGETRRRLSFTLPTPEGLSFLAGGAHYSGAIAPHSHHQDHPNLKNRRPKPVDLENAEIQAALKVVLDDLEELFCGRVTTEIMERRWRKDAIYESPHCVCKGFNQCAAQWFGIRKFMSNTERISSRVLSATFAPNRIIYTQTQLYNFRFLKKKLTVVSIIIVDLDEEFKICRLVDQWNGDQLPQWWGSFSLRKLQALVTSWVVKVPKDNGSS